jgi:1-acyl-sn-glycerol-3-phosphate acyltransferase
VHTKSPFEQGPGSAALPSPPERTVWRGERNATPDRLGTNMRIAQRSTARFLHWLFDTLFAWLTVRDVAGLDRLPAHGPYILATNHLSLYDPALIYGLIGDERFSGWAAEKWERHLIFGSILKLGQAIFIQRGQVDRKALDGALCWLRQGNVFGIAPEGTRSRTGGLIRGKTGVAYLAYESGVPILPLAHAGTEGSIRSLSHLRRQRIQVRFGDPIHLSPPDPGHRAAALRRDTDEVMCQIAAMLPPAYRGVYRDHPRLAEILRTTSAR